MGKLMKNLIYIIISSLGSPGHPGTHSCSTILNDPTDYTFFFQIYLTLPIKPYTQPEREPYIVLNRTDFSYFI